MKLRESKKHKEAEVERRKTAGKGGGPEGGGGLTLEVLRVRVTLVEDEGAQLPLLVEEEHPSPHLPQTHRVRNGQFLPPPALVAPTRSARPPRSAA